MEQLILRFENDGLQLELAHANELIKTSKLESDVETRLHESQEEIRSLRTIVQTSSHEIEVLQVGATSLVTNLIGSSFL